MSQTVTANFFAYIHRRRALMAAGGAAAIVAGVLGAVLVGTGPGAVWLGVLAVFGVLVVLGSGAGRTLVKEAATLAGGPCQKMDLTTWPYRTIRSPVNNRILVTLDVPGSLDRMPLAEFKAVWYTHGKALADAPARSADVYGTIAQGQTVFAVVDDGSCYLGRVSKTRQLSEQGG